MYQEEFADFFQFFVDASKEGQTVFPGWEPINFANPANMVVIQKVLGIGGAAKVWKFFCHCCSLTSQDIVKPNCREDACKTCKKRWKVTVLGNAFVSLSQVLKLRQDTKQHSRS